MNTYRKYAVIVGVLFIIATAFLFIGEAFYNPILTSPDYLELAYPNRSTVVIGILLEFACVIAMPLIPLFTYPILKQHSMPLALGYVVFRLFEVVIFVMTEVGKLSLISVSQGYLNGGESSLFFQNLGSAIQLELLWAFSMYVLIFAIGSLIFNTALYRAKLVPRLLSAGGVLAAAFILIGALLSMLEIFSDAAAMVFYLPIAVQEMAFALWLIFKGFNLSAIEPQIPPSEKSRVAYS